MAGVTFTYNFDDANKQMASFQRRIRTILSKAGEEGVNFARNEHSYEDQTGNLTSSIGCSVNDAGEMVGLSGFTAVKNGGDGANMGKELAKQNTAATNHIRLDVVAGMEYADHVEAGGAHRKPRNVVTFAKPVVEKEIEDGIKALFK